MSPDTDAHVIGQTTLDSFISFATDVFKNDMTVDNALARLRLGTYQVNEQALTQAKLVEHIESGTINLPPGLCAAAVGRLFAVIGIKAFEEQQTEDALGLMQWAEVVFTTYSLDVDLALAIAWIARLKTPTDAASKDLDWASAQLDFSGELGLVDQWVHHSFLDGPDKGKIQENRESQAIHLELGFRNEEAISQYEEAMSDEDDVNRIARCLLRIASIRSRSGSPQESVKLLGELEEFCVNHRLDQYLGQAIEFYIGPYCREKRLDDSISACERAKAYWLSIGNKARAAFATVKRPIVMSMGANVPDDLSSVVGSAFVDLDKLPVGLTKACAYVKLTEVLANLAGADSGEGPIEPLMARISSTRQMVEDVPRLQVLARMMEGELLWYQGNIGEAYTYFAFAGDIAEKQGFRSLRAQCQDRKDYTRVQGGRRGQSIFGLRRREQRASIFPAVLRASRQRPEDITQLIDEMGTRSYLSSLQKLRTKLLLLEIALERLEEASPVVNQLKEQSEWLVNQVVQAGSSGDWLARAKICWAKSLLALGSDDQAKAIIDNVLETGIANPEIRYELFRVKSDVALAGLNPREAHDYLVSAMDALESYRASTSSQMEFRYLFFRRMIPSLSAVVSKYIGSTARQAEREQIFLRFTQLIKGRTFDDLMNECSGRNLTNPSEGQEDLLDSLRERYIRASKGNDKEYVDVCADDYLTQLGSKYESTAYRGTVQLDLDEIKDQLKDGQSVLTLFHEDEKVHLLYVPKEGPQRLIEARVTSDVLRRAKQGIMQWEQHAGSSGPERPWNQFGDALGPQIQELMANDRPTELYLVPHGDLATLPLWALPVKDLDGTQSRIADLWPVMVLPSLSSLVSLRTYAEMPDQPNAIVFSDPDMDLKYAGDELEGITELLGTENVTAIRAEAASVYEFEKAWDQSDILVVSTHGRANRNSYLSSLEFSNGGRLFAHDVFTRPGKLTRTKLVVLSACSTGIPDERVSDEGIGMMSSFLVGGARMVLATLWSVNDQSTALLVQDFLRNLVREHMPPARALNNAVSKLRSNPNFRHPYYWAPFFLTGRAG